ncbi:MAG: iron-sulfur cluster assembly scaffold protein [Desulfotomaculaceae bacterium]|nr:iron-sulfur cluster assembly scaffold protein [Desulfotomaculaceae bacterium]
MHEAIRAYYQRLLKSGFEHTGKIENAAIYLETFGEVSPVCGNTDDFLNIYIQVDNNLISDVKYQCISDPTTNVAIEVLCTLVKGKTLDEAAMIKEDAFSQFLGCEDELMQEKAKSLLELLNAEIHRYKTQKE